MAGEVAQPGMPFAIVGSIACRRMELPDGDSRILVQMSGALRYRCHMDSLSFVFRGPAHGVRDLFKRNFSP